jgi:hypothetical protein
MLIVPDTPIRRRRTKTPPLVLVSVYYNEAAFVRLTFSRPIDISDINPSRIYILDGPMNSLRFDCVGPAVLVAADAVQLPLTEGDEYIGDRVLLMAQAGNGIVALADRSPWAGVSDFVVPY